MRQGVALGHALLRGLLNVPSGGMVVLSSRGGRGSCLSPPKTCDYAPAEKVSSARAHWPGLCLSAHP